MIGAICDGVEMRRGFAAPFVDVKVASDLRVDREEFVGVDRNAEKAGVTVVEN